LASLRINSPGTPELKARYLGGFSETTGKLPDVEESETKPGLMAWSPLRTRQMNQWNEQEWAELKAGTMSQAEFDARHQLRSRFGLSSQYPIPMLGDYPETHPLRRLVMMAVYKPSGASVVEMLIGLRHADAQTLELLAEELRDYEQRPSIVELMRMAGAPLRMAITLRQLGMVLDPAEEPTTPAPRRRGNGRRRVRLDD
jgi:hypothetical protein